MIQVLSRAFEILDIVACEPGREHSVTELAAALAIQPPTCANIIRSLVDAGYLESLGTRRGYRLGPKPFQLTRKAPYRKDLIAVATPLIKALVAELNETSTLCVLRGDRRYVLLSIAHDSPLQIQQDLLNRPDVYTTASGRLLLAHLSDADRRRFVAAAGLPRSKWPGVSSAARLGEACAAIRHAGHCTTDPGTGKTVTGIAFPVGHGAGMAALGVFLETRRFKGKHKKHILAAMNTAGRQITDILDQPRS